MATYQTTRCPYCNKAVTLFERSEFFFYTRYIGLPYERCPHCNSIYKTNKKIYCQLNQAEKEKLNILYLINIFSAIVTFFAFSFVVLTLLIYGIKSGFEYIQNIYRFNTNIDINIDSPNTLSIVAIICLVPSIIIGYKLAQRNYNDIKKINLEDFSVDEELLQLNKSEINKNFISGQDISNDLSLDKNDKEGRYIILLVTICCIFFIGLALYLNLAK